MKRRSRIGMGRAAAMLRREKWFENCRLPCFVMVVGSYAWNVSIDSNGVTPNGL